ncbi:hypothetical protein Poly30_45710 [Planctomycetes bacterium Poly30]|uniref:Salt-induced outer membrane protein n=1 Tax=Saltatorellus ferox TaxID=2528018 RepID=A0A518EY46_9BACT|nr:hypothetical protein Poly30_45710 [Planctomycetes bacterium Poly30]
MILLPLFLGSALAAANAEAPAPAALPAVASLSSLSALVHDEPAAEPEEGVWHGSINLGMSKAEGNADIETYALTGKAIRTVDIHRYTLDGLWYYATQNNVRTQRRALGSAKYDQFFSEKTYIWVNALGETNEQAAIDLRWSVSSGIGHQWRDDEEWKINTEVGLAYFNEKFDTGAKNDYLAARVAWDIWKRLTDTVVFGHFAELYPSLEDANDIYGRGETYVEAQLSARMTARLSWIAVYDNTPAEISPGVNLKRLDNLYLLNIGWTF